MVNPDWLRYFMVLAETRNFTTAAERLHLTPQAMSSALAGLEGHYGQKLVDRGPRMRGLTAAGEALLEEAPAILASFAQAERRIAALAGDRPQGPLGIGGTGYVNDYMLPRALADLVRKFPGLRPRLFALEASDIEQRVAEGRLDLGVLVRPPVRPDLAVRPGLSTPYVIVGRPGPRRQWADLVFILPRQPDADAPGAGCPSERHLDGVYNEDQGRGPWPEATHRRRIAAETDRLETAIRMAEAGLGAAYVPSLAVQDRLAAGTLAILADPPEPYVERTYVVWRKGVQPLAEAVEALAAPSL